MNAPPDMPDATWEPPGPGSWLRDSSHSSGAPTPFWRRIAGEHTKTAYARVMADNGGAIETVDMQFVNGDIYRRLVPLVGASRDNGKLPPRPALWLATRLHPKFRARNRQAAKTIETKPYLDVVAGWSSEREQWRSRNLELSAVEPTELSATELARHLRRLDAHCVSGWIRHHELHGSDLGPIGDMLVHTNSWGLDPVKVMQALQGFSPATNEAANRADEIASSLRDAGVDPATVTDINAIRAVPAAAGHLDELLDEFGWRVISGYDIEDVTLHELPGAVCALVRAAAARAADPDRTQGAAENMSASAELDELRSASPDPALFDELLGNARAAYGMRDDNGPLTWEWPAGLMRRAYLAAGQQLADTGTLARSELAFEMDVEELAATLDGAAVADDIEQRAQHRAWEKDQRGPETLGPQPDGDPDLSAFPPPLARMMEIVITASTMLEPDVDRVPVKLVGLGIGDSTYEGTARVATDPIEVINEMEPGDVLVAAWTAPSYNAVLAIAGAVVIQEGGLLSHAAVMARELGLAAVIGCHDAMSEIRSGDRVEVDPIAGRVRVIAPG